MSVGEPFPAIRKGWQCPQCGRCLSPDTSECTHGAPWYLPRVFPDTPSSPTIPSDPHRRVVVTCGSFYWDA